MNKTILALAASAFIGLTGASAFAAQHSGGAPMGAASDAAAAATTTMPATGVTAGATAGAKVDFSGTKDDAKAMNKKADADYNTAKEAFKAMKGAEEKACVKKAKVDHEVAEAHANGIHEMAEAKTDKDRAKVQAKFEKKIANEQAKAAK